MLLAVTTVVLCLFATFYLYVKRCHSAWEKRGVPSMPPTFFFGDMFDSIMGKRNLAEVIVEVYRKFSKDYKYCGFYKFIDRSVIICDPDLINDITVRDFDHFHDNEMIIDENVDYIMSKNVFVLKGHQWKTMRSLISPMFSSGKLKYIFPLVDDVSQRMIKYVDKEIDAKRNKCVDGKDLCTRFTIDNVASCAFGLDGKAFEGESDFMVIVRDFADTSYWNTIKMLLIFMFPKLSSILKMKFFKDSIEEYLTGVVSETLRYRKENNIVRNDFLDNISALKAKSTEYKFTDRDVVAQGAGFFVDGVETSSGVMSHVIYEIARHPQVQQKLREEILKTRAKNNGKLTYEAVNEMAYLDATILETLRMNGPATALFKTCTKEYTLPEISNTDNTCLKIYPGDSVILPLDGVHLDERYFPEPKSFQPERFLEENKANILKNTFMPFGNGPRFCIGMRFGLLQIKIAIIVLIGNFKVTVNDAMLPYEMHPTSLFKAPKKGFKFDFEKIN